MKQQALVFQPFVLAILVAGVALAQTPAPTVVRWQPGAPNSDRLMRNGVEILVLYQDRLIVVASFGQSDRWEVAMVSVANETGQRVEVVPSQMTLELVKPELVKPEQRWLVYQDPETVGRAVRHVSAWAYVFAAMAGMATQQSQTKGTVGGMPVNITTTTRDQAAQDRALNNIDRAKEIKAVSAAAAENSSLRENTVLPGEQVSGSVFFAFPKGFKGFKNQNPNSYANEVAQAYLGVRGSKDTNEGAEADLKVPVGGYVFEFPFGRAAKR